MAAKRPKTPDETPEAASAAAALVPQPHGGALRVGGTNRGGPGAPPSELRRRLRGSFAERVAVLEQIADGEPVKRVHVPLVAVLPFARCPRCKGKLKADPSLDAADLLLVQIEGRESASPRDRLGALDLAAKYGLGTKDELTIVSPDIVTRLERQVAVILRELPPELAERLLDALTAEVWTAT